MSIFGKTFNSNALIEEYRKYRKAIADNPIVAERDRAFVVLLKSKQRRR